MQTHCIVSRSYLALFLLLVLPYYEASQKKFWNTIRDTFLYSFYNKQLLLFHIVASFFIFFSVFLCCSLFYLQLVHTIKRQQTLLNNFKLERQQQYTITIAISLLFCYFFQFILFFGCYFVFSQICFKQKCKR